MQQQQQQQQRQQQKQQQALLQEGDVSQLSGEEVRYLEGDLLREDLGSGEERY